MIDNFDNTDDVSDEAIEAARQLVGGDAHDGGYIPSAVRNACKSKGFEADRALIIIARLIQKHEPELLVDEATLVAREIAAEVYREEGCYLTASRVRAGEYDDIREVNTAKRAYLKGKEAGNVAAD